MKKVWSMFMLLAVCLVACTNIDDLEDDVDALKKRVTALETQVRDINSNTEALRELYNEGTFITNIEEKSAEAEGKNPHCELLGNFEEPS